MASDWKSSPRNFRPWGGWRTVTQMSAHRVSPNVELSPVRNITIDLRNHKPIPRPWWSFLWERSLGGWSK